MLMEFMEISVSQGRSFLAIAFDLALPGVAPPLLPLPLFSCFIIVRPCSASTSFACQNDDDN